MIKIKPVLNLSQDLTIKNHYTICVPGETQNYYGCCLVSGRTEDLPYAEAWYALTDKAKEVWEGKIKVENGITLGRLYDSRSTT